MNEVYKIVSDICSEKRNKNISPCGALYSEVLSRTSLGHEAVQNELNRLVKEGRIRWHKTLNSLSFETVE